MSGLVSVPSQSDVEIEVRQTIEPSSGFEVDLGAHPTHFRLPISYYRVSRCFRQDTFGFHRMTTGDDVTLGTVDTGDISTTTATLPTSVFRNPSHIWWNVTVSR